MGWSGVLSICSDGARSSVPPRITDHDHSSSVVAIDADTMEVATNVAHLALTRGLHVELAEDHVASVDDTSAGVTSTSLYELGPSVGELVFE